jgi:hypothetical protein
MILYDNSICYEGKIAMGYFKAFVWTYRGRFNLLVGVFW